MKNVIISKPEINYFEIKNFYEGQILNVEFSVFILCDLGPPQSMTLKIYIKMVWSYIILDVGKMDSRGTSNLRCRELLV